MMIAFNYGYASGRGQCRATSFSNMAINIT